jgi:CheY-like chemotaxis protein/HPt (histidine-containing phosphotransfer) domain-containing protein
MPEMDGFQLVERIRELPSLKAPTVLMLSSLSTDEDLHRARELGLSFYLTKPVRRSALLSAIGQALLGSPSLPDQAAARPAARPRGRSLKVLVAEDNAVNRKLVLSILQRAGHTPVVVSNGEEAVNAMAHERFDAVLMDVQMPIMGGFEATRLIRDLEAGSGGRTPIIAVTARAMKGDREACLEAGMDAFVPKPINSARLLETLEQLAEGTQVDAPAQTTSGSQSGVAAPTATPQKHGSDVLDEAALLRLVDGNKELAGELVALFLNEIVPRMNEIRTAVVERDAVRLRSGAHALHGSAATIMASDVSAAGNALETMGRSGLLDGVQAAFEQLEVAMAILRPRLLALANGA